MIYVVLFHFPSYEVDAYVFKNYDSAIKKIEQLLERLTKERRLPPDRNYGNRAEGGIILKIRRGDYVVEIQKVNLLS